MLQRNLFYPGFTRGKRLVIIAAIAIRNATDRRRWSKLKDCSAAMTAKIGANRGKMLC